MNYKKRRERLFKVLHDYDLVMIYAGKEKYRIGDELYPFDVNRDFYYLTGLNEPNFIYLMYKNKNLLQEYLFIERYDELMAKWVGGKMKPNEASEISKININNIYYLDEFEGIISNYLNRVGQGKITLRSNYRKEEINQDDDLMVKETNRIKRHYPALKVLDISDEITKLRLIKDEDEIKELNKGIKITNKALRYVWNKLSVGMNEAEAEGYFDYVLKKEMADHSFTSIFASGINATILHYSSNNSIMENNTLLLTDLGATSNHYCADISRTVPVNGKFTKRQKEIYEMVLACNKYIINAVKPGITLADLNALTIKYYQKHLPKIGLLKHGEDVSEYYYHSVSHMLGLETHDVSLNNYKLRNGNVFTVEPGLYIEKEKIGIRIEDNVLLKDGKAVVLSKDIIKEVKDIEKFFKQK